MDANTQHHRINDETPTDLSSASQQGLERLQEGGRVEEWPPVPNQISCHNDASDFSSGSEPVIMSSASSLASSDTHTTFLSDRGTSIDGESLNDDDLMQLDGRLGSDMVFVYAPALADGPRDEHTRFPKIFPRYHINQDVGPFATEEGKPGVISQAPHFAGSDSCICSEDVLLGNLINNRRLLDKLQPKDYLI